MKNHEFIKFVTPCSVRGEMVALYADKTYSTKYIVSLEKLDVRRMMREIDGDDELNYFLSLVRHAYEIYGVAASHEAAIKYIDGGI